MITFIGNNANDQIVTDGGRLKMRLFIDLLKRENCEVNVIELDGWKRHFLRIVLKIKAEIKKRSTIVIMAGPKGCRILIPLVSILNKRKKTRVIFCPVGIGTIDKLVKHLNSEELSNFINCRNFYGIKDKRVKKFLSTFDYICPENDILDHLYRTFYGLKNTKVIENFRDIKIVKKEYKKNSNCLNIIYAGRVKEYKGILDLISVVCEINQKYKGIIKLDIYGDNQLNEANARIFDSLLSDSIKYFGAITQSDINKKLKEYDLFCLPTQYYGEGTSGALVESMISGTPALVSSYSQINALIQDKVNGFIFKIGSKEDLKQHLLQIIDEPDLLESIGVAAQESAKKFTYSYNRDTFLNVMIGEKR